MSGSRGGVVLLSFERWQLFCAKLASVVLCSGKNSGAGIWARERRFALWNGARKIAER